MKWNPPLGVNDLGDKKSGTDIDKAYMEALVAALNSLIHSESYPTVSLKDILEEVVAARGNLASVGSRIGVVVDVNGNPIIGAGTMAVVDFQKSFGVLNYAKNPTFKIWSADTLPDYWEKNGGGTVTRTGTGEGDTNKWIGQKAVLLTDAGSADTNLRQVVLDTGVASVLLNELKNRYCVMTAMAKTTDPSACRLLIGDGISSTPSSYHPGDGSWTRLQVTHQISPTMDRLYFQAQLDKASSVYLDAVSFTFTRYAPSVWVPAPVIRGWIQRPLVSPSIADGIGYWHPKEPLVITDIQGFFDTAPTGDFTIDLERDNGSGVWETMFSSPPDLLTTGVKFGNAQPDGDYRKSCMCGISGGTNKPGSGWRLNLDAVNGAANGHVSMRAIQFLNFLGEFLAYDDL